jgi:3-(3-hydroxy-phenyl)propionate hydroxylase
MNPTLNPKPTFTSAHFTNGYEFSQGAGYTLPEYEAVIPPAVKSGQVEHHRILIVGGGLAGLTLACSLAQLGVDCVLLDEDNTVGVKGASSRGICYTQKSLEIFDKLGIYERIKAKGIQWSVGRTFAGEDEVYNFDLKAQGNFNLSEQPAFVNIQQFYNEGFLVERIQQLGQEQKNVEIRWNNRVASFEVKNKLATFSIATPAGNYTATADFEAPFNENRAVWQHLMADDVWRIDYQMAPDADPAYVSREDVVRERLAKQFGKDTQVDIVWVGPYAYRSECVDRMIAPAGRSQVFFMGDSAKVVSPFGARGGNTGIADADNLAWKLAAVVQGRASESLLQSYQAERHEAAKTNVLVTNRTARFLRPADGMERVFRNATIELAKKHAFARSLVNTGRMAVANPYSQSPLTAPDLPQSHSVQNVSFKWANGSAGRLNQLLQWAGGLPLLLVWADGKQALPSSLVCLLQSQANAGQVRSVIVNASRVSIREHILDTQGQLAQACGLSVSASNLSWALIRSDSYLAARGQALTPRALNAALSRLQASPTTERSA